MAMLTDTDTTEHCYDYTVALVERESTNPLQMCGGAMPLTVEVLDYGELRLSQPQASS